jgi:heme exporter protein A
MLSATNLECVRGDRRLFSNVNFSVPEGTFLQLTGPNGSGKTSLLRIICGLMPPERGEVLWNGANIRSLAEEYFSNLTYLGHRSAVKEELSSAENLRISSGLAGKQLTRDEAYVALERMGLKGREELAARLLSEGQRRRSALARLLTCGTKLWVLDEVLTALDKAATGLITRVIEEHLTEGGIAVVATHQEINITAGSFQRLELAS